MDVSRQAVSKWEMGQSQPDLDKIIQMSELFGVTTDQLLKDEAPMPEFNPVSAEKEQKNKSGKYNILKPIGSIFWAVVLAGYLLFSFITGEWGKSWIVWPVSVVLFGIIEGIVGLVVYKGNPPNDDDDDEDDDE